MSLATSFTRHAGVPVPLICGPMYPCSNPELVAAASAAGALGVIGAASLSAKGLREEIHKVRDQTDRPFGVDVLFATIAWRWFNLIETGEILQPFLMSRDAWNRPEVERLLQERHDRGQKIFTGAFMVNSPQNRPKLPAILDCIDCCWANLDPEEIRRECTAKQAMFERIKAIPFKNDFHDFHGNGFNICPICKIGVSHNCGRVAIEQHHFIPLFFQCPAGLCA